MRAIVVAMHLFRVCTVIGLLATACDSDTTLRRVPASGFFEPSEIRFGLRNVGQVHQQATSLRNTSPQPIRVTAVRFSPSTDDFLPRLADGGTLRGTILAPGDRVDLVIRYAPTDEGDDDATMTVEFDDDFFVDVEIFATARMVEPARPAVEPASVTFVDVPLNSEARQMVRIVNAGESDGALSEMQFRAPFSVRSVEGGPVVLPTAALSPGDALTVEVVYRPTELRERSDAVIFEFDSDRRVQLFVSGTATPAGELTCTPDDFDLGPVPRGQIVPQDINCRAAGGPYELTQVRFRDGSSPSFRLAEFPTGVDANGQVEVALEFVSDSLPRNHSAVLEFVASHGAVTPVTMMAETVPPDPTRTMISLEVNWNTADTDFDLHLVRSPGLLFSSVDDCFWRQKNPDWGMAGNALDDPFLDRDDRDGFGPETINLAVAGESEYEVYVQFYNFEGDFEPSTDVTIDLQLNGQPPVRLTNAIDECGRTWRVGTLRVIDDQVDFFSVNALTDDFRNLASSRCQ